MPDKQKMKWHKKEGYTFLWRSTFSELGMQQKFFIKRFAELGDRETVPNDTQITGDVSYEQGYPYDYQRDQATDPFAKPIERTKLNALLHDITGVAQHYQMRGTPEWATKADSDGHPFPYTQCARVLYRAKETDHWAVYESLVDNNTVTPSDAEKWRRIMSAVASEEQAIAGTDNSVIMTPLRVAQMIAVSRREVGQIVFEPRTEVRPGYLKCNGALVSRTVYADLWDYAQISGVHPDRCRVASRKTRLLFLRRWGYYIPHSRSTRRVYSLLGRSARDR